jgi:hypothetical protein
MQTPEAKQNAPQARMLIAQRSINIPPLRGGISGF